MTENLIGSMIASDLNTAVKDFSVPSETTDGAGGSNETKHHFEDAGKWLAYYKTIRELRVVIDAIGKWTIGKGYEATPEIKFILDKIKGIGKDTFNKILQNLIRQTEIYGDGFAEIIRDDDGNLINLKPLDTAVMSIVVDSAGIIIRYEQNSKIKEKVTKKFRLNQIFHLMRDRIGDEIHGISLIESLEWAILAKKEVEKINKTIMQRHLKPVMIFHLDTDDPTEIAAFKAKMDKAYADGENLYVPKDVIVPEVLSVAPNATLNPQAWLEYLDSQIYQASGVPKIIVGGSSEFVEKATAVVYLAFQQTIEDKQLYNEESVGMQLGMEIKLTFPATIENELLSDEKKDGPQNIDASETTAGVGQ